MKIRVTIDLELDDERVALGEEDPDSEGLVQTVATSVELVQGDDVNCDENAEGEDGSCTLHLCAGKPIKLERHADGGLSAQFTDQTKPWRMGGNLLSLISKHAWDFVENLEQLQAEDFEKLT